MTGSTPIIKTTVTKRIETRSTFDKVSIMAFLEAIPDNAKIDVCRPSTYPGEQGVTPGYVEATWSE